MQGQSVFQAIEGVAVRHPERPALTGAGRAWTYRELLEDAGRLAGALSRAGCGPGKTIAVVSRNNPDMALVWLASARLGTTVSLVNFMLRPEELAVVLQNLEPALVFCDPAQLEVCQTALARARLPVACVLLQPEGENAIGPMLEGAAYAGPHPAPGAPHEISYTSGTTSAPKGALLTHEAVLHRGLQEVALFELDHTDAAVVVTPLFHQSGIRNTVLLMWLSGGHAVVAPKFDATTFWATVKEHQATYCCLVETMLLFLERQPVNADERGNSLRRALGNGEPELLARMEARFGMRFTTVYGMTEVGVPVAVRRALDGTALQTLRCARKDAFLAGWPLDGTDIRLAHEGQVVTGDGASGEIQIRSKTLFREYYRAPEATADAFTADGWFQTGDLGAYGPDGALFFVDRIRDVIRRGGENISSKEVETVIGDHPDVVGVAVVPAPDPIFQQEVRAVVVTRPGASLSAADLWDWCDERLARYKRPRYVEFRDSLPVGGTGRVQKQILRSEGASASFDRRHETERAC